MIALIPIVFSLATLADPPAPESLVSQDRIVESIRALPTKRSGWGSDEHRAGLIKTEQLLVKTLTDLGYTPVLDPVDFLGSRLRDRPSGEGSAPNTDVPPAHVDVPPEDAPFHNIIIEIRGQTVPDQVLVFSCHFDAVPPAPGADDDGSGVATILEAARILKERPMQRTVRLIFFNLEEAGMVGSRVYCSRIADQQKAASGPKVVGMASIDGIGYYSDAPDSQKSPIKPSKYFKPPTVGDFVGMGGILRHRAFSQALDKAMHESEPKLKTVVVDFLPLAPPDLLRSDHAPFLGMGVPAVILADTANFRSPHYHQPTDTIENVDAASLTIAIRGIVGAAYRLAGPIGQPLIVLAPPQPEAAPETEPAPPPAK